MEKFNPKAAATLLLKGMAMGAADVVPGVSGGTIAFISGIYETLLTSLKSIPQALPLLLKLKVAEFWAKINGTFLVVLLSGIAISILSLVKVIHYLLDEHPVLIWSFFFGLIVASIVTIAGKIKQYSIPILIAAAVGTGFGYFISIATPAETPNESWFIFLSGSIAICAMILPGISGSFILLLLKKYQYITGALKDGDLAVIVTFGAGAALGLLTFAQVLSWLFKRFHDLTIALLTGIMLGSLNVVWPWKRVLETRINSKGVEEAFRFESVLPNSFEGDPQLLLAITCALFGFFLIIILERVAAQKA